MLRKCFNCKWFFTCKKADPSINDCLYFSETEVKEIIRRVDNERSRQNV